MSPYILSLIQGKETSFAEALANLKSDFPLLSQLHATPQDQIWHPEGSVAIHTDMVIREAQSMVQEAGEDRLVLTLGAIFHDIGKPLCTREYKENGLTRIGSNKHAKFGADYLHPLIGRLNLGIKLTERILNIVRYHHQPRKIYRSDTDQELWKFIQIDNHQEILHFEKADLLGRNYTGVDEELEILDFVSSLVEQKQQEINIEATIAEEFPTKSASWKQFVKQKTFKFLTNGICSHPWEAISKAQNTPDDFAKVSLLCGSPRSGKTSYREQHSDKFIISLDDLRTSMTGKKDCFKKDGQVVQEAYRLFKQALASKQDIIWDSTNTTAALRKKVIETAENYAAQTSIVSFITDPREVHRRNKTSQEQVPSDVIDKFYRNWEVPTLEEAHNIEWVYS